MCWLGSCYIDDIKATVTKGVLIMSNASITYYSFMVVKAIFVGLLISLFVIFA